jgi:hypothetical protein
LHKVLNAQLGSVRDDFGTPGSPCVEHQ